MSRRRRHGLVLLGLLVAVALPWAAVTRRVRTYGWEYYRRVGPVYWMFPTQTLWSHRIGEYEVLCVQDPARGWANSDFYRRKLLIKQCGQVVFEDSSDVVVLQGDPAPGTDLNANGLPDVVVHFYSGGSATYQKHRIFELGLAGLVTLAEFSAKGESSAARFVDADGDGIWEIICNDWIYDGERSHPVPSVLLWDGSQFTRHTP